VWHFALAARSQSLTPPRFSNEYVEKTVRQCFGNLGRHVAKDSGENLMIANFSMTSHWWTLLGMVVALLCIRGQKP